ncbi:MAG: hypothetical protein AAF600_06515 [Bacteroidota bacterium]
MGLDLTEMDDHIIEYLGILKDALPPKRIFFVHIARELELPNEITDKYPDLIAPLDENISDDIYFKVAHLFQDNDIDHEVIVQEGAH